MYQRPKSSDCLVISVGRSGISVSAISKSQNPNPKFQLRSRIGIWRLGFGIWDFPMHVGDVLQPFYVVAIGKVRAKVSAAALLPPQRGARDQQADGDDAAETAELTIGEARRVGGSKQRVPRVEPRDGRVDAV